MNQEQLKSAPSPAQRILAVIVLYECAPEASASFTSLQRAAFALPPETPRPGILLYDNTPGDSPPDGLPANVRYVGDRANRGLATAYNLALSMATEQGFDWLLTLDQDTDLPESALAQYAERAAHLAGDFTVAAIVPQIIAGGRVVSPNYFLAGALPRWFAQDFSGVPAQTVFAFNSGSLLRVAALRQAGGYSPWFWLDNSDSSIYKALSDLGKKVYVDGELKLNHDFSMLNMGERISPERYQALLLSESAFWDMQMNALAGLERTARLAGRMVKHVRRSDPEPLQRLTLQALRARLLRSRGARIRVWRQATRARLGGDPQGWERPARPTLSVCMAAYNGERFIEAQLRSILPQLHAGDEVVIIDDSSRDGTVQQVRALQAELAAHGGGPRIQLLQHTSNRGVVRTFEHALRAATGDILFLCDDDDLWRRDKVERVLEVFAERPDVELVCTGVALMDVNGEPMLDQQFMKHRRFASGILHNIRHNQFQGSTMAFRSSLLRHVLPFPAGRLFLHDAWIGLVNSLAGGKTVYLPEPLLLYRRHGSNYSRRMSRVQQAQLRLELVLALFRKRLSLWWHGQGNARDRESSSR